MYSPFSPFCRVFGTGLSSHCEKFVVLQIRAVFAHEIFPAARVFLPVRVAPSVRETAPASAVFLRGTAFQTAGAPFPLILAWSQAAAREIARGDVLELHAAPVTVHAIVPSVRASARVLPGRVAATVRSSYAPWPSPPVTCRAIGQIF